MIALPTGINSFVGLLTYLNGIVYGQLGILLVIATFIITFLSLRLFGNERAFIPAAVIAFVSAVTFRALGILNSIWLFTFLFLASAGVLYLMFSEDYG
jgi:hypothetical protein